MQKGDQLFDDPQMSATYRQVRHRPDSPNETLEKPVIWALLGEVKDLDILDLGCGDGRFGVDLLAVGCKSYLGIDASARMVAIAQENLENSNGRVEQARIEEGAYLAEKFDLVVSRLALHYVADLEETFQQVHHALRDNGRFIFSIVHPVITSADKSREGGGIRQDWIVDNYFASGPRRVYFKGEYVQQYHRPLEEIVQFFQKAGFQIEQIRESRPRREHFNDDALYERRRRIPLFLFLSGRK